MIRAMLLILLLAPIAIQAQDKFVVAKMPSADQVASAEDVIRKARGSPIVIPYGGYAIAEMDFATKLKAYIVPGSDDCLKRLPLPKGAAYDGWLVPKTKTAFEFTSIAADKDKDRFLFTGIKEGTATLLWIANGATPNDEPVVVAAFQFIVGKPKPPDPEPPGPDPPIPPMPSNGFRVLIVTETKDLSTLPASQVQAMTAKDVRDYLDSHCVKENNQPEYRIFDQNIDLSKASQVWKDAMARPRTSLPWIVITNGKTGTEGPLPANKDELLKMLKTYGGQ